MATRNPHQGLCPPPFLQESTFPETGGFLPGRFCQPIPQLLNLTCCLPCPLEDLLYSDGFQSRTEIANWVNVAAVLATAFCLLSFAFLDTKYTHRHYLSICLTIAVACIEIAFIVPLAAQPDQCFNEITPNDMKSDGVCATSGAFLLFGGWGAVIWVFLRALSLHLQICWEVVPGNKFFISSLVFGWGIPVIALTLVLSLTGVSYRFGNVCHVNHRLALENFWGPLLGFAAIGMVLQFITLGYCIHVYIKSLMSGNASTETSSNMQSYSGSVATRSARQTFRRVKRVVELQWRGAAIVLLIIGEVVFFSVVFVSMDNSFQLSDDLIRTATPWLTCLTDPSKTKDDCLPLVSSLTQSEGVVLAVLICLGLSGVWCIIFFGRWSMVLGWKDLFQRKLLRKNEFVSADAHRNDPRTYEMLGGTSQPLNLNPPDRAYTSPMSPEPRGWGDDDAMDKSAQYGGVRTYVTPATSYSVPRPPSSGINKDWDPRLTWAKSHPVSRSGKN